MKADSSTGLCMGWCEGCEFYMLRYGLLKSVSSTGLCMVWCEGCAFYMLMVWFGVNDVSSRC